MSTLSAKEYKCFEDIKQSPSRWLRILGSKGACSRAGLCKMGELL